MKKNKHRKTGPRFYMKKPEKKYALCNHPVHGVMLYLPNGWLVRADNIDVGSVTDVVEYHDRMRVQGDDSTVSGTGTIGRGECNRCGREMSVNRLMDGLCETCYRIEEDVEEEIKMLREAWKWSSDSPNNMRNSGACYAHKVGDEI